MGVEEEGTVEVRKKDKKFNKNSKNGEKDEVSDNGIYEIEGGGKDEVIKGDRIADKEDGDSGYIGKKKKKKIHKLGEENGEKSVENKKTEVGNNSIDKTEHGGKNKVTEGGESAEKEDSERGDIEKKKKKKKCKVGEDSGEKYTKNEVSNNGISETKNNDENKLIMGGKTAEKEDAIRGNIKKKKKKRKCSVGEDNSDGHEEIEKENDDGKQFELDWGRNHDENIVEKVERKKKKRENKKNIGFANYVQEQDLEDAKDGRRSCMDGTYGNVMQNGKRVEAIGRVLDGDVVVKLENKRKKNKEIVEAHSGDKPQDNCYLTTNETQENKNQRGKGVKIEAFREDHEKKKTKREKKIENDGSAVTGQGIVAEEYMKGITNSTMNEKSDSNMENGSKGKRKKAKLVDTVSEDPELKKGKKKVRFSGNDPKPKKGQKRVRFLGNVEVFPISNDSSSGSGNNEDNLVRGKRFSKEEDEIVKKAVLNYIETHCLGEEGLKKVLNCKAHPEVKNCWKEITTCLPNRPHSAIYHRAQVLFRRDEKHKWTEEEIEFLRKSQEIKGLEKQWKLVADELGKHRFHVKDTWRRIKHKTFKKGSWSQEEYQTLFDSVNTDLRMKYREEKKSKHGMLRDNIPWTAISDRLSTRSVANCCLKWYDQLTSRMVDEGEWANVDDYRLIDALFQLDASCTEDVDWDNLLEDRPGDICRKRWNQMVLHIGNYGNKSFADQVEVLAKRYCPDLLEARETWDSKPVVP